MTSFIGWLVRYGLHLYLQYYLTHFQHVDELLSKKRFEEAARVFLDHANNIRQCVSALVQGNLFSEARRIVSVLLEQSDRKADETKIALHRDQSLIGEIVEPALLDSRAQIAEDLEEMRTQLRKQTGRLHELRVKKAEEPGALFQSIRVQALIFPEPTRYLLRR